MPESITSLIHAENGRTYRLTHPVDATDDQIREAAAAYLKRAEPERNYPAAQIDRPKPESFLQGMEQGASKVGFNLARVAESAADALGVKEPLQAFGRAIQPGQQFDSVEAAQQNFNQRMDAAPTQGSALGRFAGEAAATLPTAMLPGVALPGAAAGALLTDERDAFGVGKDAVVGAAGAVVGDRALRSMAGLIGPQVSNDVRTLANEGVITTPGQRAGSANPGEIAPGRAARKVEDIAASLPIAGAGVQNAQYRGVVSLNRAAANRALRPIGERAPADVPVGHDLIRYTGDRLSQAYNDVLPRLRGTVDRTFETRIQAIQQRANIPPEYQGQLDAALGDLGNAFQRAGANGAYNGRTLRDASEQLGDLSSAWRRSDDPYIRRVGEVAQQYRDQLHALARRQNPQDATRLRDIDRGYASLVRLERAASGTPDGIATPRQYDAAVRGADTSARRRQSARGRALDQDLSGAASRVMANTAAQGGSKDVNSLVALGLLGTRAISGDPLAIAGVGGAVGGSAAYSRIGQDLLQRLATRNPVLIDQLTAQGLRYAAPASGVFAPALMNGGE